MSRPRRGSIRTRSEAPLASIGFAGDHWIVEPVVSGFPLVCQKIPGYPGVSNLPLGFFDSVESLMTRW